MISKNNFTESLDFKSRKIVHYSLILCILLIQIIVVGYFYNEFISKRNLAFIEKELKEINELDKLTDDSRKELFSAQKYLQQYLINEDEKLLDSYFTSLESLGKNLDNINRYKSKYPKLNNIIASHKKDSLNSKNLKILIDSTYQYSVSSDFKSQKNLPKLERYDVDYDFNRLDVKTQTYSDTVKKKGLFGRVGDAILGRVNVRKDSTVVTVKNGKKLDKATVKKEFDSIFNRINDNYIKQIQKIQVNAYQNQRNEGKFYRIFNNLLIYSNSMMNMYEGAINDSKAHLQKEYDKQNSKSGKIRNYLIFGAMILMIIVSILIMYFTRIAFLYERKLKAANDQINENLNFKNRILGMLSHELRSPLKIIGIFINRINKKTNDENIKEYLKSISFTNNTLLMQANQILEYTKNQQVENKLIPVVFNLKDEIKSILTSIEPYIETRNNRFIVQKNIDPALEVYSDNTKINQVFMNILGNANKFTENGEIKVKIRTEDIDENTVRMITEISDTGVGISKSDLGKIFEPYYQGVLSDEVENLGAGLGLSLCKELVELYPGSISVTSEQNKGTIVTFSVNLTINK